MLKIIQVLAIFLNSISAILVILAFFIYSILYTMILKRRTPLATEIGGIAGALPPLIGWVSISGNLDPRAFTIFFIIFFWQSPHFWSLAMRNIRDYKKAKVPVLPLVNPERLRSRFILHLCLLLIASLLPYVTGITGLKYLIIALFFGIIFIVLFVLNNILKRGSNIDMFSYSILYLTILFVFLLIDTKN